MAVKYTEISEDPYVALPADRLIEGAPLPCTVYFEDGDKAVPLFNEGLLYDSAAASVVKSKNIRAILVRRRDYAGFEKYIAKGSAQQAEQPEEKIFKDYSFAKEQYHQIDRKLLVPGTEICFSIYSSSRYVFTPLLEASEQAPKRLDNKVLQATGDLVIKKQDILLFSAYINALLKAPPAEAGDAQKIKAAAIRENSKLILRDLLDNPRSGEKIKESIIQVNNMVDSILKNKDAVYDLLSLRTHDYYTYTHSVNVAALSVGLAIASGLDRGRTEKLGIGAMLHDIGKSAIPHEILNKPGRLTDEEFAIMKTHVIESERLLRPQKEIPEESFVALLQHHERLTGRGYPFGVSGRQVQLFGRITAIADCYDAMTTQRVYKPAFTPFHALSIMVNERESYDPELLAAFIKMLGRLE